MKNWEFYEEQIKKCDYNFGMENNEIFDCSDKPCRRCYFSSIHDLCEKSRIKFLYQEHETIHLTDDEKTLCRMIGGGWITRDSDGELWWYKKKPTKGTVGSWLDRSGSALEISSPFPQCKFDFIKWEDEEPWEVKVDD